MKILNNIVNGALVVSMFLAIGAVVFTAVNTNDNDHQDIIKELNKEYVFVYPYPTDLPPDVNLCVDVIKPGITRDTVWLMPDLESAGY